MHFQHQDNEATDVSAHNSATTNRCHQQSYQRQTFKKRTINRLLHPLTTDAPGQKWEAGIHRNEEPHFLWQTLSSPLPMENQIGSAGPRQRTETPQYLVKRLYITIERTPQCVREKTSGEIKS